MGNCQACDNFVNNEAKNEYDDSVIYQTSVFML